LNKYRVLAEEYIDKRGFNVNTFILPQYVGVSIGSQYIDRWILVLYTVLRTVYPVLGRNRLCGIGGCW
jgi:hypothetical protein